MNTKKQDEFLTSALAGENIFLTGKAGTGKSYIVKEFIKMMKKLDKNVVALAPTGVAANNIEGQTIHSFFSLNPYGILDFKSCNFLKGEKRRLIQNVDTFIIDEVSMLRPDVFDAINWTLLKNGCKKIEKFQFILIGDLAQLEPVVNDNSRSVLLEKYPDIFMFHAKIFNKLKFKTIELDEILRQSDPEFIHNLNIIRDGGKSDYFKRFIGEKNDGIILAPLKTTVQYYNEQGLASIESDEIVFDADVWGNVNAEDFLLETTLKLKHGCKVMYLVNSKDNNNLVNGTLGVFNIIDGKYFFTVGDVNYALCPISLSKKEYVLNESKNKLELVNVGGITQYPIKLAYALTIHKSQGLTFDEVTLDLKRPCFSKGQLYTALSRVRSPKGLKIIL